MTSIPLIGKTALLAPTATAFDPSSFCLGNKTLDLNANSESMKSKDVFLTTVKADIEQARNSAGKPAYPGVQGNEIIPQLILSEGGSRVSGTKLLELLKTRNITFADGSSLTLEDLSKEIKKSNPPKNFIIAVNAAVKEDSPEYADLVKLAKDISYPIAVFDYDGNSTFLMSPNGSPKRTDGYIESSLGARDRDLDDCDRGYFIK